MLEELGRRDAENAEADADEVGQDGTVGIEDDVQPAAVVDADDAAGIRADDVAEAEVAESARHFRAKARHRDGSPFVQRLRDELRRQGIVDDPKRAEIGVHVDDAAPARGPGALGCRNHDERAAGHGRHGDRERGHREQREGESSLSSHRCGLPASGFP